MDENQETTAADLDKAAEEAVASQQNIEQETVQETGEVQEQAAETVVEELDTEGLPKEHKERSDLGRKVAAYHRRMDELDNKFDRIMNYLENSQKPKDDPLDELDPNEPITIKDVEAMMARRENEKKSREKTYNDNYVRTVAGLGGDMDQDEYDAVIAEMQSITYNPSEDPVKDAEINFYRAERAYLRKKIAQPVQKKNPLEGKTPEGKIGVATSQKTVVKQTAMPKLDADAQAYIDFVRETDGEERANKLIKEIGSGGNI